MVRQCTVKLWFDVHDVQLTVFVGIDEGDLIWGITTDDARIHRREVALTVVQPRELDVAGLGHLQWEVFDR